MSCESATVAVRRRSRGGQELHQGGREDVRRPVRAQSAGAPPRARTRRAVVRADDTDGVTHARRRVAAAAAASSRGRHRPDHVRRASAARHSCRPTHRRDDGGSVGGPRCGGADGELSRPLPRRERDAAQRGQRRTGEGGQGAHTRRGDRGRQRFPGPRPADLHSPVQRISGRGASRSSPADQPSVGSCGRSGRVTVHRFSARVRTSPRDGSRLRRRSPPSGLRGHPRGRGDSIRPQRPGVALLPESVARSRAGADPALALRPVAGADMHRQVHLVAPQLQLRSVACQAFIRCVDDHLGSTASR